MRIVVTPSETIKTLEELQGLLRPILETGAEATILLGFPNIPLIEPPAKETIKIMAVTSILNDIQVTKKGREHSLLLDGEVKKVKEITLAGVGGIDPHQNIEALIKSKEKPEVIVSYFPTKGCGDYIPQLNVRKGLEELKELINQVNPATLITGGTSNDQCRIHETLILTVTKKSYLIIDFTSYGEPESFRWLKLSSH